MHEITLTIKLSQEVVKYLYSDDFIPHTGIRIETTKRNNVLIDSTERDKNSRHPNPAERIFDIKVSSLKGTINVVCGPDKSQEKKIKEVTLDGQTEITIDFP